MLDSRGPAIDPSLVTCPTMSLAMSRAFARRDHSGGDLTRTWLAIAADPSTSALAIVCTESTTHQPRPDLLDLPEHGCEIGLRREEQGVRRRTDPLRPRADLSRRLSPLT